VVSRFGVAYTNRAEETDPVRVTTAFKRLMDLDGVTVTDVVFEAGRMVVTVKLRSGKLCCPECGYTTRSRYDARPVASTWRHLDLGPWRLEVRAVLGRLRCPTHGVRTQKVPFARAGSRFTADFEDLVGWLATTMDKTALCRLVRIDWDWQESVRAAGSAAGSQNAPHCLGTITVRVSTMPRLYDRVFHGCPVQAPPDRVNGCV